MSIRVAPPTTLSSDTRLDHVQIALVQIALVTTTERLLHPGRKEVQRDFLTRSPQ